MKNFKNDRLQGHQKHDSRATRSSAFFSPVQRIKPSWFNMLIALIVAALATLLPLVGIGDEIKIGEVLNLPAKTVGNEGRGMLNVIFTSGKKPGGVSFTESEDKSCQELLLNGMWDFSPFELEKELSAEEAFESKSYEIKVPSLWDYAKGYRLKDPSDSLKCQKGWYKRTLYVPETLAGETFKLCFDGVMLYCEAYVNGNSCGTHVGGCTPFEMDVTEFIRPGERNEIVVFVQDKSYAIKASLKELKTLPTRGFWHGVPKGALLAPMSLSGGGVGIWQDVYLRAYPAIHIGKVTIRPSVADKQLDWQVEIINGLKKDKAVTVRSAVFSAKKKAVILWNDHFGTEPDTQIQDFSAQDRQVVLKSGINTLSFRTNWIAPKLWTPETPNLYYLKTEIEGETAKLTRFGFREISIAGKDILLNGNIYRFRGSCTAMVMGHTARLNRAYLTAKYRNYKEHHQNILHTLPEIPPEIVYQVADELGMFIIPQLPLMQRYHLFREGGGVFWENCDAIVKEMTECAGNHPSVAFYGVEDEMLRSPGATEFVKRVSALFEKYDDSRYRLHPGDGDAFGTGPIFCQAYLFSKNTIIGKHAYEKWQRLSDKPVLSYYYFRNYTHFPSDDLFNWDCYLRNNVLCNKWALESLRMGGMPISLRFGQLDFGLASPFKRERIKFNYENLETSSLKIDEISGTAFRWFMLSNPWDPSAPLYRDTEVSKALAKASSPLFIGFKGDSYDYYSGLAVNYYAGETLNKYIFICNDTLEEQELEVTWGTINENSIREYGSERFKLYPGQIVDREITVKLAENLIGEDAELFARLFKKGQLVSENTLRLEVFPALRKPKIEKRVVLYGDDAATENFLRQNGINCAKFDTVSKLSANDILIIGTETSGSDLDKRKSGLLAFMNGGGRIICLKQSVPFEWTPTAVAVASAPSRTAYSFYLRYAPEKTYSRTVTSAITAEGHPVFKGLSSASLCNWKAEDNRIADDLFYSPGKFLVTGNYRVLANATKDHVVMMEMFHGTGGLILCQYRVDLNYGKDPAADLLTMNMLEYADSRQSGFEPRKMYFSGVDDVLKRLEELGVKVNALGQDTVPESGSLIVIQGKVPSFVSGEDISKWTDAGCEVFLAEIEKGEILRDLKSVEANGVNVIYANSPDLKKHPMEIAYGLHSSILGEQSELAIETENAEFETLVLGGNRARGLVFGGKSDDTAQREFQDMGKYALMCRKPARNGGGVTCCQFPVFRNNKKMNAVLCSIFSNLRIRIDTPDAEEKMRTKAGSGADENVYQCIPAGDVVIDGMLGEWTFEDITGAEIVNFRHANPIPITADMQVRKNADNSRQNADNSAIAYLMHDDENIYFAIKVIDDRIVLPSENDCYYYEFDSVELWINKVQFVFSFDKHGNGLTFMLSDLKNDFVKNGKVVGKKVGNLGISMDMDILAQGESGDVSKSGGYTLEAAIPKRYLRIADPSFDTRPLKFAVIVHDLDIQNETTGIIGFPSTWEWGKPETFSDMRLMKNP